MGITGGASGIGRATAAACLAAGMKVAIGDLDAATTRQVAESLGDGAIGLALDVTDRPAFAAFLDEVEARLGPLDVLVNCAGALGPVGRFSKADPAAIDRVVAVNLGGALHGSQLALQRFRDRDSGHLVNIASILGLVPAPGASAYSATKHGIVGLTRSLRQELHGSGVRATVVCPGHVDTPMASVLGRMRGLRVIAPEAIAAGIVEALRTGRGEVVLPRELRLVPILDLLPPRASDALKRFARFGRPLERPTLDVPRLPKH